MPCFRCQTTLTLDEHRDATAWFICDDCLAAERPRLAVHRSEHSARPVDVPQDTPQEPNNLPAAARADGGGDFLCGAI